MLKHWWSKGLTLEEEYYLALGHLLRATEPLPSMRLLRERALCLFTRRWNEWVRRTRRGRPLPDELRVMAADAYADLCRLHPTYRKDEKEKLPEPLQGLDVVRLQDRWPLDRSLLEDVVAACLVASDEEDAAAETLFREFARAVNDGRREAALELVDALLSRYRSTDVVRQRLEQIESTRATLT